MLILLILPGAHAGQAIPLEPQFAIGTTASPTIATGWGTERLTPPQELFVTRDLSASDGIDGIGQPASVAIVGGVPAASPWGVVWPTDIPAEYRPSLPLAPSGTLVVTLSGGNQTIWASNREYRLSGNVGQITIASGTQRIIIDGRGFRANGIRLPAVWPVPGVPSVSDIVVRDITLNGSSSGTAIEGACRRLLLQRVVTHRANVPKYCLYTRFSEDIVIEDCQFDTQGNEACVRLVDVRRFAGFRNVFDSGLKHAFRIHQSTHGVWLSDTTCGKPLYLGYSAQDPGSHLENLRDVKLRRLHVHPQVGGWVLNFTDPSRLIGMEMTDCTFHADGPLTTNNVNSFRTLANATWHWSQSNLVVVQ